MKRKMGKNINVQDLLKGLQGQSTPFDIDNCYVVLIRGHGELLHSSLLDSPSDLTDKNQNLLLKYKNKIQQIKVPQNTLVKMNAKCGYKISPLSSSNAFTTNNIIRNHIHNLSNPNANFTLLGNSQEYWDILIKAKPSYEVVWTGPATSRRKKQPFKNDGIDIFRYKMSTLTHVSSHHDTNTLSNIITECRTRVSNSSGDKNANVIFLIDTCRSGFSKITGYQQVVVAPTKNIVINQALKRIRRHAQQKEIQIGLDRVSRNLKENKNVNVRIGNTVYKLKRVQKMYNDKQYKTFLDIVEVNNKNMELLTEHEHASTQNTMRKLKNVQKNVQ